VPVHTAGRPLAPEPPAAPRATSPGGGRRPRHAAPSRPSVSPGALDRLVLPLTVLVVGLGAVWWRRPGAFLRPELWAEDGAVWFADAYREGPWRPLDQPHTGYLQSFPRLVADLGLLLPLRDLALVFAVVAAVVQVLPAVLVTSARASEAVPSRAGRLVLATAYLAVPNSFEVDANLTNAQWHLALAAFLCLALAPAGRLWRTLDLVVTVLSGLTGPFVVALALIGAYLVWSTRWRTWTVVLWLVSALLAGVQAGVLLASPRGHFAPLGASPALLVRIVGGQVGLGALVGMTGLSRLGRGPLALGADVAGFVLVLGAFGAALLAGPPALRALAAWAGAILAASLVSPVASSTTPQWQALSLPGVAVRYWVLPELALLATLVWGASRAAAAGRSLLARRRDPAPRAASSPRGRGGTRRERGRRAALVGGTLAGALLALSAAVAMPSDWSYPTLPPVGYRAALARFARARPGAVVRLPLEPPGWSVSLVKR
jgi:hypothetical protein